MMPNSNIANMNDAELLLEYLKEYFSVTSYQELSLKLGVARNTISGWKQRNATNVIRKLIQERDIPIDILDILTKRVSPDMSGMDGIVLNDAEILLDELKDYYKVGSDQKLSLKLGVSFSTISGWRKRNTISSIRSKIYELGLEIDIVAVLRKNKMTDIFAPSFSLSESNRIFPFDHQEEFNKLLMLAKGVGGLNIVNDFLVNCKEELLSHANGETTVEKKNKAND